MEEALKDIIREINKIENKEELERLKINVCRKYNIPLMLNSQILSELKNPSPKISSLLRTKPVRSSSGVSVVAVMTKPFDCPHGKCIMCPKGKNAPQSYTGKEPATMRAISADYDPQKQVQSRLKQLEVVGHPTNKIEIIIMGGTFTSMPVDYTTSFVKGIFDSLNCVESKSLEEAQIKNQNSEHRCVGMTIETRPDYCFQKDIEYILNLGATRVELGVQSDSNEILKNIKRGHSVEDTITSTQLLKDSAYKINYHLMTGLPGSDPNKDLQTFKNIFTNPYFKPDMIKIYPTMVVKGTELYDMWKKGDYKTYSDKELLNLIKEIKKIVPPWVRIMRIQRDIPLTQSEAGISKGNIREEAKKEVCCKCIRCREIRNKSLKDITPELTVREYEASKSKEFFISLEDSKKDILIGFVRLRIPHKPFMPQIDKETGLIREIHVYGEEKELHQKGKTQHIGFGKKLLKKAEEKAKEEGMKKVVVISGVGAREYFKKLGYVQDGPYFSKWL